MKIENIGIFEEKSYTECPLYKKMTEGRYPWGSDDDKVLKYCANDVTIIAEQIAREKQKELEAKADKYEDILVDICDALDPHFDFDKYDDVIEVFENLPSRILDLKRSWKDNFDECIRKMDIIDELKAENSKLKEEIKTLKSDVDYKDTQLGAMRLGRRKDDERWNNLNKNFWLPLCDKLYDTRKVNKTYEEILSDISKLKDIADEEIEKLRLTLGEKTEDLYELSDNYDELFDKHDKLKCKLLDILQKKEELEARVTELIKASKRKDELIQDYREKLKKANDENGTLYEDLEYWKERCHKAETDVTTLNSKVEVLKNKSDKYLNKIINQQVTHYKQCSRILELENMVSKLQSGEYDDILAKDIEIKSLQAKYEDAMAGWKDAIDTNDKQIEELTHRYNMIAKKLNDIHDILKEESDNE